MATSTSTLINDSAQVDLSLMMRKVNLLDKIKVSLETIMFENKGNLYANWSNQTWQNTSAIMVKFCRYILAVLEDGLKVQQQQQQQHHQNAESDNNNMLSSSYKSSQSDVHLDSMASQSSPEEVDHHHQILWSLVSTTFSMEDNNSNNDNNNDVYENESGFILTNSRNSQAIDLVKEENQAKKDFKTVQKQILNQNDQTNNMALEWITNSLRNYTLLNQLKFILSNEKNRRLLSANYRMDAFILDDAAVRDFLIYVRAYEQRDTSLLNQIKLKKTTFMMQQKRNNSCCSTNSYSSTAAATTLSSFFEIAQHQQAHHHRFATTKTTYSSGSDSGGVVGDNQLRPHAGSSSANLSISNLSIEEKNKNATEDDGRDQDQQDSLIEKHINELNAKNSARAAKKSMHRRLHSFPNIQINMQKKMEMQNNNSIATSTSTTTDATLTSATSASMLVSMPKFELNNEIKELDDLITEPSSIAKSIDVDVVEHHDGDESGKDDDNEDDDNDIYKKTSVFDFIQAQQIHCERTVLDKENSHFIMADIAISSIELIKSQDIEDLDDECFYNHQNLAIAATTASRKSVGDKRAAATTMKSKKLETIMDDENQVTPITMMTQSDGKKRVRQVSNSIAIDLSSLTTTTNNNESSSYSPLHFHSSPSQPLLFNGDDLFISSSINIDQQKLHNINTDNNSTNNNQENEEEDDDEEDLAHPVAVAAPPHFSVSPVELDSSSLSSRNNNFLSEQQKLKKQKWLAAVSNHQNSNFSDSSFSFNNESIQQLHPSPQFLSSFDSSSIISTHQSADDQQQQQQQQSHDFEILNTKDASVVQMKNKNSNSSNNSQMTTTRQRRYSWEEIENMDTAERIAVKLIELCMSLQMSKRLLDNDNDENVINHHQIKIIPVPTLKQLEMFIQNVEIEEYFQTYFELRTSPDLKKLASLQQLSASQRSNLTRQLSVSASTMYLSHSSSEFSSLSLNSNSNNSSKNAKNHQHQSILSKLFSRSNTSISKTSSPVKLLKSAALAAAAAASLNHQMKLNQEKQQNQTDCRRRDSLDSFTILSVKSTDQEHQQSSNNNSNNLIRQSTMPVSMPVSKSNLIRQISTSNFNSSSVGVDHQLSLSSSHQSAASLLNNYKQLNARIIGEDDWAPVREQLILNVTPKKKRVEQMELQRYRCADCGIQVKPDKMKTFNYCEYFGKYFCRCCHINEQSYIPAYVVELSDFKTSFQVSKKAKNFLLKIYSEPLITLESLNEALFANPNSQYSKIKRLRLRLNRSRLYISSCRFALDLRNKLENDFEDFIYTGTDVYSIETLFKFKKGTYYEQLKVLVNKIAEHIKACELCSQKGFVCEICSRKDDILYPFDLDRVEKCEHCLTCYHKSCFNKQQQQQCLRCERMKNRKQSSNQNSSTLASTSTSSSSSNQITVQ